MTKQEKKAEKAMDKYPNRTVRVQFGHGEKDSIMFNETGGEYVKLLELNYSYNGKQGYYTAEGTINCPKIKFAINDITQKAYLVSRKDAMEIFILNNKERSSFNGFITLTWISLYSHITYMAVLMGDGNDFALFQGKCNGKYGKQLQMKIRNNEQNWGEKFLEMSNGDKAYEEAEI